MSVWRDLVSSVQTNHGNAVVKVDEDRIEVVLGGVTLIAVKESDASFVVDVTGKAQARFDSAKYAGYHVYDELNKIWAANQKPRTTRGGASYSGRSGGDVDVIGHTYEPSTSDDGDDE
jgi:hypothetical protein